MFIRNIIYHPKKITQHNVDEIKTKLSSEEVIHLILMTLNLKNRLQFTYLSSIICRIRKDIYS